MAIELELNGFLYLWFQFLGMIIKWTPTTPGHSARS